MKLKLLVIFLFCFIKLWGQQLSYKDIEKGLSNNTVTSIYQDRYGWMWFGTFDGLNRYDGYSFLKFRKQNNENSLPDNFISTISEDVSGNLWVGTRTGVSIYNAISNTFSGLKILDTLHKAKAELLKDYILSLSSNADGTMWIGANKAGLFYLKKGENGAIKVPLKDNSGLIIEYAVPAILPDGNQNVWFFARGIGLCSYKLGSKEAHVVNRLVKDGTCLGSAPNNELWIGTNAGLLLFSKINGNLSKIDGGRPEISNSRIMAITQEGNKLWISTDGDGIIVLDVIKKEVVKILKQGDEQSISSNAIYSVFIDKAHRKWIGTMRGGINCIDPNRNSFKTYSHQPYNQNSLSHNVVMSFCEDGDNIWIGTDGKGINIWNRKTENFKQYKFNVSNRGSSGANQITAIIKDNEGFIFVASYGSGVKRFDKATSSFKNIPFLQPDQSSKYVWRLFKDHKNNIWAGCLKGRWAGKLTRTLFLYNRETERFEPSIYPIEDEILSIEEDQKENLWIGTFFSGLIQINPIKNTLKCFKTDTYIRDIYASKDSTLWVATNDKGLWNFNPQSGKFKIYNEANGLANNTVVSIEKDEKGYIWAGTFNGLSRLNPKNGKIYNFTVADGLQSNQFYYNASFHLKNGALMFGGVKGFNIFNPNQISMSRNFPSLLISGIKILGKPVNMDNPYITSVSPYNISQIKLPYDESMFSLEVTALAYSAPEKVKYRYLLEGWDKEWNYVDNRTISYSRLNAGHYTLKINATNYIGDWNANSKEIKIVVLPPWYRTWWAYLIYALIGISIVYLYVYYQKKQERLIYDIKIAKLQTLQQQELNEKRISFFTNISHELRTPLTLIINPIKDLLNNNGKNFNLLDINAAYRNARRLLSLVDQLLLFRSAENEITELKPEILDMVEVVHEVFMCFTNQVKVKQINYKFETTYEKLDNFVDREKIEIVLFNLISNAIKYTPIKGTVTVELQTAQNFVEILVKDTGKGIPPEVGEKLFQRFYRLDQGSSVAKESGFGIGLFVSRKIAEKQEGNITYYSNGLDQGTVFKYSLPIQERPFSENEKKVESSTTLLNELITDNRLFESTSPVINKNDLLYQSVTSDKPLVLIVDDNVELRNYMREILLDSYHVLECESADIATEVLKNVDPNIILCDIVMPGMSGVDFCVELKSSNKSYIPLILITGNSSEETKMKGIESGADDYITKPFEKDLLLARIKSILKGRASLKKYFFNEITFQQNNESISEEYSKFLKKGIAIIERHLRDENFNVGMFVSEMEMSHSTVFRKIKSISDLSISEFIRHIRLKKAAELMIQSDIQVKQVAFMVGINDIKYFRKEFVVLFGLTPSEYIKKYRSTYL